MKNKSSFKQIKQKICSCLHTVPWKHKINLEFPRVLWGACVFLTYLQKYSGVAGSSTKGLTWRRGIKVRIFEFGSSLISNNMKFEPARLGCIRWRQKVNAQMYLWSTRLVQITLPSLQAKAFTFLDNMMQMSTSLTFMDSHVLILNPISRGRWCEFLSAPTQVKRPRPCCCLGLTSVCFLCAPHMASCLLSGYVLLLMDCTAWTCCSRLVSSPSQACSRADVLVLSQPSTSTIASTPLPTII